MTQAWTSFWHVLWSAQWAANVGLPMAVSVAAIAVAYLLFRTQLAHDRQLARQDAERSRTAAEQDRRRAALATFGAALRRLTLAPDNDLLVTTEQRYLDLIWPEAIRARDLLGDVPIVSLAADVAHDYDLRRDAVRRWRQAAAGEARETNDDRFAVLAWVSPDLDALTSAAVACMTWDGATTLDGDRIALLHYVHPWQEAMRLADRGQSLAMSFDERWTECRRDPLQYTRSRKVEL